MNGYTKIKMTEIEVDPETFDSKLFSDALSKCQNRDFGWLIVNFHESIQPDLADNFLQVTKILQLCEAKTVEFNLNFERGPFLNHELIS